MGSQASGMTPDQVSTIRDQQQSTLLVPTVFTWSDGGDSVFFCGTFNNWRERIPMNQIKPGVWQATRELAPGRYEFKFIVDSQWRCSNNYQNSKDAASNVNNFIVVTANAQQEKEKTEGHPDQMEIIEQHFGFNLPEQPYQLWNTFPQELPKQLVKTPLNAGIVDAEFQPTQLLPIPDHVVLTHYFRQRKRKAFSVAASTARYRGKYVTLVLYLCNDDGFAPDCDELTSLVVEGGIQLQERHKKDQVEPPTLMTIRD